MKITATILLNVVSVIATPVTTYLCSDSFRDAVTSIFGNPFANDHPPAPERDPYNRPGVFNRPRGYYRVVWQRFAEVTRNAVVELIPSMNWSVV